MRQRVDEAYVLRTHPFGEADLIVTLLAEHRGRVRGVARSARKSRRRFGGALEPLTHVTARWSEKPGRELHRLDALEIRRSHAAIQTEPVVQAACAVMAEISSSLAREEQADPKEFRLLGAVLGALESGLDAWVALRYFEYWTLRIHGLLPDLEACEACGRAFASGTARVFVRGHGVRCTGCAAASGSAGRRLGRGDRAFLSAAAGRPPTEMGEHRAACRPGGALEQFLRGTLESFVERTFRSYRHLDLDPARTSRPAGGTPR